MEVGRCSHLVVSEIRNQGGEVIAYQCTGCTVVLAHHGECDGCHRERRLSVLVPSKRKRYCTEECRATSMRAERKAREAEIEIKDETKKPEER